MDIFQNDELDNIDNRIQYYVDASNMSLQELLNYKNQWRTPFLFYIDYTSDIAPDDNTLYGIASKEMLIAFSYSGNIYRCIDGTNWILCSKDWDDLPNDLVLRRIFDKDVNNSHMIEIHWQDGLQFWVDGGTMVFNTANFQAGVDTLYNKCVSCGQTPSDKSPTAISNAIQSIYTNRYNEGYNNGRTQGQNDVKGNPNGYGLYTQQQYDQNYTNGYNAGKTATKQVSVRTFISSHAWQCYAITYINDKEVCRVDSRNPSDDSTITKSNTATANV